jgi:glucose-6-phosphate dehydrogenase assembly protein OpcA
VEAAVTALVTPRHTVAPNAIPDALRKIWRECCQDDADNSVSRALITNLVAVVTSERERSMRATLEALSARLPCRAFLVVMTPGDGPIQAEVHGAAREHGTTRDLVLEQIELSVPEGAFARLPGLVRPLLVHDIPTRLYWGAPWPQDPRRFDALATMADLSILDSSRFVLPASDLDAFETRRRRGMQVVDLEWMRLRPWRRALAEVFERIRYQPKLHTTSVVRHGEGAMAAAILLARWLEERLSAHVAIESTGAGGNLCGVDIQHGGAAASVTLVDPGRIEVAVETEEACFLPFGVPASRGGEGDLLAAAIDLA